MKKIIINLLFLFLIISAYCQEFAPIGAEWYYTEKHAFSGDITFLKITSEKDTIIDGKTCRVLHKTGNPIFSGRPDTEYLYKEDGVLRFYDKNFNRFQVLYDLTKEVNESWVIEAIDSYDETNVLSIEITVNSISSIVINEQSLKRLHVSYSLLDSHNNSYESIIIENIGDIQYLFNYYPYSYIAGGGNYSDGLRCYQDSEIGLYSTGVAESCDYVYISTRINKIKSQTPQIHTFPNPAQNYVEIVIEKVSEYTAELYDLNGKYLKSTSTFNSNTRLDLTDLEKGLYLILIKDGNQTIGYRKLIKK